MVLNDIRQIPRTLNIILELVGIYEEDGGDHRHEEDDDKVQARIQVWELPDQVEVQGGGGQAEGVGQEAWGATQRLPEDWEEAEEHHWEQQKHVHLPHLLKSRREEDGCEEDSIEADGGAGEALGDIVKHDGSLYLAIVIQEEVDQNEY